MFSILKGDKVLWVILALLAIFSFLPVFSASSNLAYVVGRGTPWDFLMKHLFVLVIGFVLMFFMHKVPFQYFKGISILMLPFVFVLLIYTASQGTIIQGANASRWIQIPIIGLSFQTSTLASVVLMVYVAHYLSKTPIHSPFFKTSFVPMWIPVLGIVFLILPANLSTAGLLLMMVFILCFLGGYPVKYLFGMMGTTMLMLVLFIFLSKSFPDLMPNRIDTWISRIESFSNSSNSSGNYQIERAKTAIASGGIFGMGAGKSLMKNFLPQSSSDFIYAIIVEEFGMLGGVGLVLLYVLLLFRVLVITNRTENIFGKLVVIGLGMPIIFQAFVNIGVALQVFPVTGQTLPMISSGGTSAWMTCISFGIILSVSASFNRKEEQEQQTNINDDNPLSILSETV